MADAAARRRSPLWLSLAWREILNNRVFSLTFALSLSLGLSGYLLLDAFKVSLSAHLDERSRAMLGADLGVFGDRPLTEAERGTLTSTLPHGSKTRPEIILMSMVARGDLSRLVEVKAVDDAYPFYGEIGLRVQGERRAGVATDLTGQRHVWVYPELLAQLGAKVGDTVHVGAAEFTISDVVENDPAVAAAGLQIAPLLFIGINHLDETALLGKGSRAFHTTLVQLPAQGPDAEMVAGQLKEAYRAASPELRVKPHRAASEDLYRALLHLSDYLGLVALVALFFAGVGGAYLFRSFLERRCKDIAVLLSLGLDPASVRLVYMAQLVLLGLAATALTALISAALLPAVPRVLGSLMPAGVSPHLTLGGLALTLGMGIGGSLLACLPLLGRLGAIQPAALFQEAASPKLDVRPRHLVWWLPALAAFYASAVATSHSFRTGSLFTGIFLAAAAVCALAALLLIRAAEHAGTRRSSLPLALATLSLARHRLATLASFVALGLGALLINLVPEIRQVLASELERPGGEKTPSLFLFDIQEEQVAPLTATLKGLGAQLDLPSPMIRARLTGINGEAVGKASAQKGEAVTREGEEEQRALNRGYNLSYRPGLAPSEQLVAGRPMQDRYDAAAGKPAEISLEEHFATRLGVGLGDRLSFDVQGVAVDGVVVNTRSVRWTSFQPNFFVQFQPGVLDDAPKTFVAAIPALTAAAKLETQTALVRQFPNVSMVDVAATIERILAIVAQMARTLIFMAVLSLAAGLAVLFSIARYQALRRLPDVTLLKVLGASFGDLQKAAALEFGVLGLAAAGLGALLSMGAAYVLAEVLFDRAWSFDWVSPLATALGLTAVTMLVGLLAVSRSLRTPAVTILNQE